MASCGAAGCSFRPSHTAPRSRGERQALPLSSPASSSLSLSRKPATNHSVLSCRSSAAPQGATVAQAEAPSTSPRYSPGNPGANLPQELATLEDLVSQLSQAGSSGGDADVAELKRAFGALAEDLKRQISSVEFKPPTPPNSSRTTPNSAPSASQKLPGRRRLVPQTDSETFKAKAGLSDLEGLFPKSQAQSAAESKGTPSEPMVPRSEVTVMRSKLNKKLSESNTYNRFLTREIQYREEAIKETKAVLVALLSELREVSAAVSEMATVESFLPTTTLSPESKPSLVSVKLKGLLDDLDKQLKGVDAMKLREIPLVWYGMAEDVKVMGSFDGWTYGEQMSPETTGSMTRFSTVLKLRPGRYEIKFKVDGEWRIAPEWPTVGHGMTENNVLIVD